MSRWLKLLLTWMLALALPLQALAAGAMVHCGGHAGAGHHAPPGHGHGDVAAQAAAADRAAGHPAHAHHRPAAGDAAQAALDRGTASAKAQVPGTPAADAAIASAVAPAADAAADPSSAHSSLGLHGKCSACAACCGVVALPSTAPALGSVAVDTAYAVASLPAPAGHVPAGDERPPRHL